MSSQRVLARPTRGYRFESNGIFDHLKPRLQSFLADAKKFKDSEFAEPAIRCTANGNNISNLKPL